MEEIKKRWFAHTETLAKRVVEDIDQETAQYLRDEFLNNVPTNEQELEWGIAFSNWSQAGHDLVEVLVKQNKLIEGELILNVMEELCAQLLIMRSGVKISKEFCKEIKLTRPL